MNADLFMPRPVFVAQMNAERFTPEFLAMLPDNLHVFERFEQEAFKVIVKGFKHYSARTIVEVLRHHSALQDAGSQFKLNDWHTPYYARLFVLLNPTHADLFEFRQAKAAQRAHEGVAA